MMQQATHRMLPDGRRLHLQHGPIDLIVEAWGAPDEVAASYEQTVERFETVLTELVGELPRLREPVDAACRLQGTTARRMWRATACHLPRFVTPMAAVAGAVADEVLAAMTRGRDLRRAYLNNGGDIALYFPPARPRESGDPEIWPSSHWVPACAGTSDRAEASDRGRDDFRLALASRRPPPPAPPPEGEGGDGAYACSLPPRGGGLGWGPPLGGGPSRLRTGPGFRIGLVVDPGDPRMPGAVEITADMPVRGVATSGRHGRSFSLGIADSVTVLAGCAAAADAAATLIANAVDLPGHRAVRREPACTLDPDSDLGERQVTTGVGPLSAGDIDAALAAGVDAAEDMIDEGLICAAVLVLGQSVRLVGDTGAEAPQRQKRENRVDA